MPPADGPNPTTVSVVEVNDGSPQRSEVRSITITFSGLVNFAGGNANAAAAFQLNHIQMGNNVALTAVVSTNGSGQTVVTLIFSGDETDPVMPITAAAPLLPMAGIAYHRQRSVMDGIGANLDGDGDGVIGGNYVSPTDAQRRWDRRVQGLIPAVRGYQRGRDCRPVGSGAVSLREQFHSIDLGYIAYLDADNSGTIDQIDLGQFRQSASNSSVFPSTPR